MTFLQMNSLTDSWSIHSVSFRAEKNYTVNGEEMAFVGVTGFHLLTSLTYSVALLDAENAPKPKKSQMQITDGLKTLAFGKKGKN